MDRRIRCGLCEYQLRNDESWESHIKSEMHQGNMGDARKIDEAYRKSQSKVLEAVEKLINE